MTNCKKVCPQGKKTAAYGKFRPHRRTKVAAALACLVPLLAAGYLSGAAGAVPEGITTEAENEWTSNSWRAAGNAGFTVTGDVVLAADADSYPGLIAYYYSGYTDWDTDTPISIVMKEGASLYVSDFDFNTGGISVRDGAKVNITGEGGNTITLYEDYDTSEESLTITGSIKMMTDEIGQHSELNISGVNIRLASFDGISAACDSALSITGADYVHIGLDADDNPIYSGRGIEATNGSSSIYIQTGELKVYSKGVTTDYGGMALIRTNARTDSDESFDEALAAQGPASIVIEAETVDLQAVSGTNPSIGNGVMAWAGDEMLADAAVKISGGEFSLTSDWAYMINSYAKTHNAEVILDFDRNITITDTNTASYGVKVYSYGETESAAGLTAGEDIRISAGTAVRVDGGSGSNKASAHLTAKNITLAANNNVMNVQALGNSTAEAVLAAENDIGLTSDYVGIFSYTGGSSVSSASLEAGGDIALSAVSNGISIRAEGTGSASVTAAAGGDITVTSGGNGILNWEVSGTAGAFLKAGGTVSVSGSGSSVYTLSNGSGAAQTDITAGADIILAAASNYAVCNYVSSTGASGVVLDAKGGVEAASDSNTALWQKAAGSGSASASVSAAKDITVTSGWNAVYNGAGAGSSDMVLEAGGSIRFTAAKNGVYSESYGAGSVKTTLSAGENITLAATDYDAVYSCSSGTGASGVVLDAKGGVTASSDNYTTFWQRVTGSGSAAVSVSAAENISVASGAIGVYNNLQGTGTSSVGFAAEGDVSFDTAGNGLSTYAAADGSVISAAAAGGGITVTSGYNGVYNGAGAGSANTNLAAAGNIALTAANNAVYNESGGAGKAVTALSAKGDILLSAASYNAVYSYTASAGSSEVTLEAEGSVTAAAETNTALSQQVNGSGSASLAVSAGKDITVTSGWNAVYSGAAAGKSVISLDAAGSIALTAANNGVYSWSDGEGGAQSALTAGGDITLAADSSAVRVYTAGTGTAAVQIETGGGIAVEAAGTAFRSEVASGGSGGISLKAGRDIGVTSGDIGLSSAVSGAGTSAAVFEAAGDIAFETADTGISAAAGSGSAETVLSAAGSIRVTAAADNGVLSSAESGKSSVRLAAGGGIAVEAADTALTAEAGSGTSEVLLAAGGDIRVSSAASGLYSSTAGAGDASVLLDAAGGIAIEAADTALRAQASAGGAAKTAAEAAGDIRIASDGAGLYSYSAGGSSSAAAKAGGLLTVSAAGAAATAVASGGGSAETLLSGKDAVITPSADTFTLAAAAADGESSAAVAASAAGTLTIASDSASYVAYAQGAGASVSLEAGTLMLAQTSGVLALALEGGAVRLNYSTAGTTQLTGYLCAEYGGSVDVGLAGADSYFTGGASDLTGLSAVTDAAASGEGASEEAAGRADTASGDESGSDSGSASDADSSTAFYALAGGEAEDAGDAAVSAESAAAESSEAGAVRIYAGSGARWNVRLFSDGTNLLYSNIALYSSEGKDANGVSSYVDLTGETAGQNLYIGKLTGSDVRFILRTQVDENRYTGEQTDTYRDRVIIQEGSGSHTVLVKAVGNAGAEDAAWVAEVQADFLIQHYEANGAASAAVSMDEDGNAVALPAAEGALAFTLANAGQAVDVGNRRYVLQTRDVTDAGGSRIGTEWYLKYAGEVPAAEAASFMETPDAESFVLDQDFSNLSSSAKLVTTLMGTGVMYSAWTANLSDLRKRLGEVRFGAQDGLWARALRQKDRTDGITGGSFTQKLKGIQIGADHIVRKTEDSMWLAGVNFKYAEGDQKVRGMDYGRGDLKTYGAFLYATYADHSGYYTDLVLSLDHYSEKMRAQQSDYTMTYGSYSTWGWGASVETGRMFSSAQSDEGWGPWYANWWAEPQLQLAYYRGQGRSFRLDNGMTVDQKGGQSLIGRAGVVIGRKYSCGRNRQEVSRKYAQFYVKGGVKQEFLGDQKLAVNGEKFSGNLRGPRVYYGAGFDWNVTDSLRVYAQAEREQGSKYKKDYQVSVGLKWQF